MALSAFADRTCPPEEGQLAAVLGESFVLWNELQATFPRLRPEWGFTAASTGWGLRLKQDARIIVYMTPCAGHFLASFALGERAVQAARTSALSAAVLDVIEGARKYAEGRGVRLTVARPEDLPGIVILVGVKMAH